MVPTSLALDVLLVMLAFTWAALALFFPTRLRWLGRGALLTGLALVASSALMGLVVCEAWRTVRDIELGVDARAGYLGYAAAVAQAEGAVERHALAVFATAVLVGGAAFALRLRSRSARTLVPAGLTLAFAELLAAPALVVLRRNATMRPGGDATQSLLSAREAAQEVLVEGRLHVGLSVVAGSLTVMLALAAARARGHDPFRRARPALERAGYALFAVGLVAFGLTRAHAHDAQLVLEPDEKLCPAALPPELVDELPRSEFESSGPEARYLLRVREGGAELGGQGFHSAESVRRQLDLLAESPFGEDWRGPPTVLLAAPRWPARHAEAWIEGLRDDARVRALVRLPDRELETATLGTLARRARCGAVELDVAFPPSEAKALAELGVGAEKREKERAEGRDEGGCW